MDFPTAWRLARSWPFDQHDPICSYRTNEGAFLCDCLILNADMGPLDAAPEPQVVEVLAVDEPHTEGFSVNEQEAIAEESAWADQMQAEMTPSAELVVTEAPPAPTVLTDDIDPPVDPLDIPDHYDLPMHGSILACPKCGGDKQTENGKLTGLRTFFHEQGILHAPCGQRFGWPDVQNLGEHLCRICERCQYGWPEQVFHGSA